MSRSAGADRLEDANALLLHAIIIAISFGIVFTVGANILGADIGRFHARPSPATRE